MISDLHSVHGVFETPRRLTVRFAHAPRVKLTLQVRIQSAFTPAIARVLRLRKEIQPKVRYDSATQSCSAR